jgi:prepilin-type N-terminal cleavage/methylation domain-containing protein
MFSPRFKQHRGFTLIELIIIIVVLGILAAVAIPRYSNITDEAREASARAALGGLRSGIAIYYASKAVETGQPQWPPLDSLQAIGVVMEHDIPGNPYINNTLYPDSIIAGTTKGAVEGATCGWKYNESTGEIWANSTADSANTW